MAKAYIPHSCAGSCHFTGNVPERRAKMTGILTLAVRMLIFIVSTLHQVVKKRNEPTETPGEVTEKDAAFSLLALFFLLLALSFPLLALSFALSAPFFPLLALLFPLSALSFPFFSQSSIVSRYCHSATYPFFTRISYQLTNNQ